MWRIFFVLLIMFLTACGPAVIVPIASPTPDVAVIPILPSSTPTQQPRPICPPQGNPSDPVAPSSMSLEWIYGTILDYLNQGGSPEKITSELANLKYPNPFDAKTNLGIKIEMNKLDVNNDGVDELAFSSGVILISTGTSGVANISRDSGLWIFQCEDGKYEVLYQIQYQGVSSPFDGNPRLVGFADLNNDKEKEIVIHSTWRGSGCLEYFDVLELGKGSPIQFLDPFVAFPCETQFAVGDLDSNGNREILFQGLSDGRYDSVGGIQRGFVDTYALNSQKMYSLVSHKYLPSPYRIYALYDAQKAIKDSNFDLAIQFYDKAAHDVTLQDINSFCFFASDFGCMFRTLNKNLGTVDHPQQYLSAFALFRLTLLYLRNGNDQKATSTLNELDINYPAGSYGSEFTEAAHLLKDEFEAGKGFTLSCNAVTSLIENKYPLLEWHFDWSTWTWFYYSNQMFCPYSADVNWLRVK